MTELERIQICSNCMLYACAEDVPSLAPQCPLNQIEVSDLRERQQRYERTQKAKQRQRKYNQSFKGAVNRLRYQLRRK